MLLAVAVTSACGGGGGTDTTLDAPAGRGTTAEPLVVLVRYGGIAGIHERVSVDAFGQATIATDRSPTTRTRALPAADLTNLRTALERSEIATLERSYLDPRAADAYQFDVTYQGVTVTADEGVLPPRLRPVVEQLTVLLA